MADPNSNYSSLEWLDGIEQDLKGISFKNWKEKTINWEIWKDVLDQAKAHLGPRMMMKNEKNKNATTNLVVWIRSRVW